MRKSTFLKEAHTDYDIIEATEGEEALELMKATDNSVSLAIVDVMMQPIDGFKFINELRSRDIDTPIILVTGDKTSDLLERAAKLGVGSVLIKPVEKDRLLKTVDRALESMRRVH